MRTSTALNTPTLGTLGRHYAVLQPSTFDASRASPSRSLLLGLEHPVPHFVISPTVWTPVTHGERFSGASVVRLYPHGAPSRTPSTALVPYPPAPLAALSSLSSPSPLENPSSMALCGFSATNIAAPSTLNSSSFTFQLPSRPLACCRHRHLHAP